MAGDLGAASTARTPARTAPKPPAPASSASKQRSIVSFFQKSSPAPSPREKVAPAPHCLQETTRANSLPKPKPRPSAKLSTPVPSSDAVEAPSSPGDENRGSAPEPLPSPTTTTAPSELCSSTPQAAGQPSPSRKAKRGVSYAESSDEDEPFARRGRASKARGRPARPAVEDEDDYGESDAAAAAALDDLDYMADFVMSDESDATPRSRKRKRASRRPQPARKRSNVSSPAAKGPESPLVADDEPLDDLVPASTAARWSYDAQSAEKRPVTRPPERAGRDPAVKEKAHTREPEERYPWLADIRDKDKRRPGDPDYDGRTIYIPPMAWNKFSPFEKQYWAIKQNLWDTIVFFKKGKFYELYENDATVGHQQFDFKMTDRVNMRMVGVPESSLDHWVNQFIAKQYKVARVDQMETNLGKEMRERQDKSGKKADKVISRELACVLTGGTLVDGSMLQDDMAAYCLCIKESVVDGSPAFGVACADTATGRFRLSGFVDDADLTRFETLIAQTAPRELVVERSHLSTRALRVLRKGTSPTTIWTRLRPGSEFWDADTARRELSCGGYFAAPDAWPEALQRHRDDDLVMSAVGGLVSYLGFLKLERPLLSQGSFETYSPIRGSGTLVLDGQTLVNLELFANSTTGGTEGTLFGLLNKCVTPFGKRQFRQWVAHPLRDAARIDERLDAVELLNADASVREQFASQLVKMPDLERLVSRIHAGACRADDFARVLDGFEQIEYTVGLLGAYRGGGGLVDGLLSSMPDLGEPLGYWRTAFDRLRAREDRVLIPERGVDDGFDASAARIDGIKGRLEALLEAKRAELGCKALRFADVGKEIYQVEAPKAAKVPASWRQMSATRDVKRWYFGELTQLVRELQEAEETHSQLVREAAARFFRKFDADREAWLRALQVAATLDCLVSLARASASLGQPCCRPRFVDEERSRVEFAQLRHPCMTGAVDDFIPNDVRLGGDEAKMNLLTGANAAGKSTILRMSCVAVVMAQVGCFVPAASARLTPVDRIMSRLGANDNIFAAQSTFLVELAETKKMLREAGPRSLVILDELGRGTSSYDGVAVAQAVLHHVATHVGCLGFFATHYHSLAAEFEGHPEVRARRMQIHVNDAARRVAFLYRLEDGVAEGSFGMHCAAMCGVARPVVERAEAAARAWEHTSRLKESLDRARAACYLPLGLLSDVAALLGDKGDVGDGAVDVLLRAVARL